MKKISATVKNEEETVQTVVENAGKKGTFILANIGDVIFWAAPGETLEEVLGRYNKIKRIREKEAFLQQQAIEAGDKLLVLLSNPQNLSNHTEVLLWAREVETCILSIRAYFEKDYDFTIRILSNITIDPSNPNNAVLMKEIMDMVERIEGNKRRIDDVKKKALTILSARGYPNSSCDCICDYNCFKNDSVHKEIAEIIERLKGGVRSFSFGAIPPPSTIQ